MSVIAPYGVKGYLNVKENYSYSRKEFTTWVVTRFPPCY